MVSLSQHNLNVVPNAFHFMNLLLVAFIFPLAMKLINFFLLFISALHHLHLLTKIISAPLPIPNVLNTLAYVFHHLRTG